MVANNCMFVPRVKTALSAGYVIASTPHPPHPPLCASSSDHYYCACGRILPAILIPTLLLSVDRLTAPEGAISDAAAAALAAWRGGSVPAPGGGGGAGKTKKLSAQGNNLTKYWGAPLPSSKKSGAKRSGAAAAAGGLASGRGGFEFGGGGATPDRPSRATAFGGGRAAASGTLEKVRVEQRLGVVAFIFSRVFGTGALLFFAEALLVGYG